MKNFSTYLTKHNILIALSVFFVAVFIVVLVTKENKSEEYVSDDKSALVFAESLELDSDGDGVLDWEESLFGTDPFSKDSDGDGRPDNKEIEDLREQLESENPELFAEKELNETERFSRELFSTLVSLQEGGNLSPEGLQNISQSILTEISPDRLQNTYTIANFQATEATTENKLRYRAQVAQILDDYRSTQMGREMDIVLQGIQPEATLDTETLSEIASIYREAEARLAKVNPTSNLLIDHALFVNTIAKISTTIDQFAEVESNPVVGLSAIASYKEYSDDLVDIINQIKQKTS